MKTGRSIVENIYGPDQKIEKVGLSRSNDGKQDAWAYQGPDGSLEIEVSTHHDGKVTRVEFYEKGTLARGGGRRRRRSSR
jgi:hypothetical protein